MVLKEKVNIYLSIDIEIEHHCGNLITVYLVMHRSYRF